MVINQNKPRRVSVFVREIPQIDRRVVVIFSARTIAAESDGVADGYVLRKSSGVNRHAFMA